MKKIILYGYGYVGKAVEELFKNHYQLIIKDPGLNMNPSDEDLAEPELAIICVPTPSNKDGSCDTSIVEEIVRNIPQKLILIKSTVEPGTTQALIDMTKKDIVFSPEYVSESTYNNPYFKSMQENPFVILGGSAKARSKIIEYLEIIYGPMVKFFQCNSTEAELIKYMANIYSALKITFVNEMYDLSKSLGIDWHTVREGWLLDDRVEPMSTMVFSSKRGFDGKCLPKDTLALIKLAQKQGLELELLSSINRQNKKYAEDRLK